MTSSTPTPDEAPVPQAKQTLTNEMYNFLKWLAQIFLPAAGTLYFALAGIWNLPNPEKVVGTITAVDLFLGVLLKLATTQYVNSGAAYDGVIDVQNTADSKLFSLNLHSDPNLLDEKSQVTFKVNSNAVLAASSPDEQGQLPLS